MLNFRVEIGGNKKFRYTQHMRRPEEWRGGGYYEVPRKHVLNVKNKNKYELLNMDIWII